MLNFYNAFFEHEMLVYLLWKCRLATALNDFISFFGVDPQGNMGVPSQKGQMAGRFQRCLVTGVQ